MTISVDMCTLVPRMATAGTTPLGRWKLRHDLNYEQVGERLGIKPDYARKIGCGALRPSPELALQIEERSGGEIKAVDLVFGDAEPAVEGAA